MNLIFHAVGPETNGIRSTDVRVYNQGETNVYIYSIRGRMMDAFLVNAYQISKIVEEAESRTNATILVNNT